MKFLGSEITGRLLAYVSPREKPVEAISHVNGFTISMKQGVVPSSLQHPNDVTPMTPPHERVYYDVTMQSTGENPEYPKNRKPIVARFTVRHDNAVSMLPGAHSIPSGSRYTGFEVVEEFKDSASRPGILLGCDLPSHHTVMLRARFISPQGEKSSIGLGGYVRKSERQTYDWDAATSAPVMSI